MLYRSYTAYFLVMSLQISRVSGVYIAVVILTWLYQCLGLALSKGLSRVRLFPFHLRTDTNLFSEKLYFLVFFIISNVGQNLKAHTTTGRTRHHHGIQRAYTGPLIKN
jgi:hypothetical protein